MGFVIILVTVAGVLIRRIPGGAGSDIRSSARGRRVTTSHSAGPVRLRSSRVCTRHLTISMPTGPFSPSRTVKRVHPYTPSDWRHARTACHGALGRRPRP